MSASACQSSAIAAIRSAVGVWASQGSVSSSRSRPSQRAWTPARRGGLDLNQGPYALRADGAAIRELRALGVLLPLWNPAS